MYQKINELKIHHQFIYSLLIGIGIISAWRGVWGLLDLYLFPNSPDISILASMVLGVTILFITHNRLS